MITGTDDKEWLSGGPGPDIIHAMGNRDILFGGPGDDAVDGGDGPDRLSYIPSRTPVEVDLEDGFAQGEGFDDIVGVEELAGSNFSDRLAADAEDNIIIGVNGDDVILGRGGNDYLSGDFEDFTSDGGRDRLRGGSGDDRLHGGGNRDRLNGGPGIDVASFFFAGRPVLADLKQGRATGHGVDTLEAIEGLQGSIDHPDTLKGDGSANPLDGGDEESAPAAGLPDTLIGRGGDDVLEGFTGDDTLKGGRGGDELMGGTGDDHLDGGLGIDSLDGGSGTDECVNGETVTNCE